jgi:hypothetical protein
MHLAIYSVVVFLLAGCSTCSTQSFYKPIAVAGKQYRSGSQTPNMAELDLKGKAKLSVGTCGNSNPASRVFQLCMVVELDENTTMQFTEPKVKVVKSEQATQYILLTTIEYDIFCKKNERGEKNCTSSEAPPTEGSISKVQSRPGLDRYAFSASQKFSGTTDTLLTGAYFGHRVKGRRKYIIKAMPIEMKNDQSIILEFLPIAIDGEKIDLGRVTFQPVTENICRMVPLA